jgi:hypothetical protein
MAARFSSVPRSFSERNAREVHDDPVFENRGHPDKSICVRIKASMARFHAIAVIVALLSAPMALLVRGIVCDPAECTCMTVCAGHMSNSSGRAKDLCGAPKESAPMCGTHQGHHALDYGFAAPMVFREFVALYGQSSILGVAPAPFEPPRS